MAGELTSSPDQRILSLTKSCAGLGARNVRIEISTKWSSSTPGFRENLRKALKQATACETVLDNKNVFEWAGGHFSISHSEKAGGYAISADPIGLDIETADRELSEKAYHRISDEEERELGITPIELWVAKEAAFKALNSAFYSESRPTPDFSLKTISQIKIAKKTALKTGAPYRFSFKLRKFEGLGSFGEGIIDSQNETCLGVAVIIT